MSGNELGILAVIFEELNGPYIAAHRFSLKLTQVKEQEYAVKDVKAPADNQYGRFEFCPGSE